MYCAYITTIRKITKHPNADRLQCCEIFGNNVIVDLSYKEGDRVIYFPVDGQLGLDYASDNNLLIKKDENGNNVGGYLDPKKRNIKALKLRGEKSEGLVLPIATLSKYTNVDKLRDGDQITVLDGHEICCKYIPQTKERNNNPNLIYHGFVESTEPFFLNSTAFVCPLQFGSGMKVKNIEALF